MPIGEIPSVEAYGKPTAVMAVSTCRLPRCLLSSTPQKSGCPWLCITDDDAGFSSLNQNPARFSGSVAAFHQKSHFSARLTRAIAEFLALQDDSATACRIFSHSNIPGVLIFHIKQFVVHIGSFIVFYADFVAVFFTLQQNPANSCVSAAGFRSFF